jgi:hypothetical protein
MKSKVLFLLLAFSFLCSSLIARAQSNQDDPAAIISAFRFYKDVDIYSIDVPTVVEISLANDPLGRFEFAILDKTANIFEPYFLKQKINEIPVSISANPITSNPEKMIDKNNGTYTDFPLPENTAGQTQIILTSNVPITSSSLTIFPDKNVKLPTSIEIRSIAMGQNIIVVANQKIDQPTVRFPQTTSGSWQITFTYDQPLRISELQLNQDYTAMSNDRALRFLAQPKHSYWIYLDPDKSIATSTKETGNLASAQNVLAITAPSKKNPDYIIADTDKDGVPDIRDNCVSIVNSDQMDINNNSKGDVCDDFDQDGLMNSNDNCLDNPNQNQKDSDSDGIGDICDKEESRLTEHYPWIPWVGIGFAAVVLVILFIQTAKATKIESQNSGQ